MTPRTPARKDLKEWLVFLRAEGHILARSPGLLFQQAANRPDPTSIARAAERRLEAGGHVRPWLRHVNKPQRPPSVLMTMPAAAKGFATACRFSPDGTRVVSAAGSGWSADTPSGRNTLQVWNAENGVALLTVSEQNWASDCAFSPDSKRIVTATSGGALSIRDADTGEVTMALTGQEHGVWTCAFSPDGNRIASGGDTLRIWDSRTGAQILATGPHGAILSCAWSPDGARIVSASEDGTARLWDARSGEELAVVARNERRTRSDGYGNSASMSDCAFAPDGKRIATCSSGGTTIWDAVTGHSVASMTGTVLACTFSPDGRRMALACGDGGVRLWEPGEPLVLLGRHEGGQPVDCDWSHDGSWVVSCGQEGKLHIWDAASTELAPRPAPRLVRSCALSSDGRLIASASADGSVALWDAATGTLARSLGKHEGEAVAVAFSPDGRRVLSYGRDVQLKLWDVTTGAELTSTSGSMNHVDPAVFAPDGLSVVTADLHGGLEIRDTDTGRIQRNLGGHRGEVSSCVFSPDGRRLLSTSRDGAKVWDRMTGKRLLRLGTRWALLLDDLLDLLGPSAPQLCRQATYGAFSPNGARLLTLSRDGEIRLWDSVTGELRATLVGHTDKITACAFSPDSTRVASTSADKTIRIWDADSGSTVREIHVPGIWFPHCAFSPDGRLLALYSINATVSVWDADTGDRVAEFHTQGGWAAPGGWSRGREFVVGSATAGVQLLRLEQPTMGD